MPSKKKVDAHLTFSELIAFKDIGIAALLLIREGTHAKSTAAPTETFWSYLCVELLRVHLDDLLDASGAGRLEGGVDRVLLVVRAGHVHVGSCGQRRSS